MVEVSSPVDTHNTSSGTTMSQPAQALDAPTETSFADDTERGQSLAREKLSAQPVDKDSPMQVESNNLLHLDGRDMVLIDPTLNQAESEKQGNSVSRVIPLHPGLK